MMRGGSARRKGQEVRFAVVAAMAAIVPPVGAAQPVERYTSTINFQWTGEAPERLMDEDPYTGPRAVDQVRNPQRWEARHSTASPLSRIYLAYAGETYLLPYRSYRGAEPVTVIVVRPGYSCINSSLDRMEATLGEDVTAQLAAMMAAGNLLRRPASQCPRSSKRRLVDLYFRLNCQLAQSRSFIGYLDEAESAYRERWRGDAGRAQIAQQCRQNANGAFRNAMTGMATRLAQAGRNAEFIALGRDIHALALQPAWAETFRDYALTNVDINAWEISNLVSEQVTAERAGRLSEASAMNAQLQKRASDPLQRAAFERADVSLVRISSDGRDIRAAIAIGEHTYPSAPAEAQATSSVMGPR